MARSALLAAGFMAAGAMAQAAFAVEGWEYAGCISAEPSQFPQYNPFATAPTPQQCQEVFKGHRSYAALANGGCYTADSGVTPVYILVSDDLCKNPCQGNDASKGLCGGGKDANNNQFFSLYKVKDTKGTTPPKHDFTYKNTTGPSIPCHPGCVDKKGNGELICTSPEGSCNGIPYGAVCPWESCYRDLPCPTDIVVVCENPKGCGNIKHGSPCGPEGCTSRCPPGGCKVIICECEYGCGIIKKGYGCPNGRCPSDNKPDICLIPEGCGPVKNGHPCPPGGCKSSSITVVVCGCDLGCGTIKKGETCPPKGCPPDNKKPVCLIPEGCGSVKHGEVCPAGGCKSSSVTIICQCEYGCGTIKKGEVCPAKGCPPDNKPVVCLIPEGCGSVKHGEVCPAGGCKGSSTTVVVCQYEYGCGTIKKGETCPAHGCPPENKPPVTTVQVVKPTGTGSVKVTDTPNKPVIVSGAEKLFASTFAAVAAFAVLGFNFA